MYISYTFTIPDQNMGWLVTTLAAFIKFCIAYAFYGTCLQTLELYPTCVRQTGMSFGLVSASGFGIFGPYIVYLVSKR